MVMKMNSDFVVAVHSLVFLAYAPDNLKTSDNIAKSVSIHPVRVRKVLSLLRKHGFIQSKHGAKGGFMLAQDPRTITLDKLYILTSEGSLKPKWPNSNQKCAIGANIERAMDGVFETTEQRVMANLEDYTIADVLLRVEEQD